MLMMLWHHKCNDIQSTSHPMTVILPSHGTIVVFSVIDLRWSMIDVFFWRSTMFVALSPLWWKLFFSGQYQVRLHNNCVYSKIGLFLEALKQQRRMSITIQSITSLIRNGPSLWCISKPVHICSPGVCKVLLRHLYHDPLYHSHQMHIFWNR